MGIFLLFDAAHSDMRRFMSPRTGAWPSLLWTDESQAVFSVHIDSILQIFIHVKEPQWKCGNRFKTKFMFKNHNRKYHTTVYIDCQRRIFFQLKLLTFITCTTNLMPHPAFFFFSMSRFARLPSHLTLNSFLMKQKIKYINHLSTRLNKC